MPKFRDPNAQVVVVWDDNSVSVGLTSLTNVIKHRYYSGEDLMPSQILLVENGKAREVFLRFVGQQNHEYDYLDREYALLDSADAEMDGTEFAFYVSLDGRA